VSKGNGGSHCGIAKLPPPASRSCSLISGRLESTFEAIYELEAGMCYNEQSRKPLIRRLAVTAIGEDSSGNFSTNSVTANMLGTNTYAYDQNGNLTNDGYRSFAYDDENELIAVWVTNAWSNGFAYDGKMRCRIERDYAWNIANSQWAETNEVHFIYDGNVVVEERNADNVPLVSYTRGNDASGTLQGTAGIGGLLARTTYGREVPGAPTTAFYLDNTTDIAVSRSDSPSPVFNTVLYNSTPGPSGCIRCRHLK
jgi:hypothetical protein